MFFHGTHGSPGVRRAFSGVFSKPGWLHTRRKRLFDLARSLDGRFGSAGGVRRGDSARFAPCRAPKRRRPRDAPGSRRRRRGVAMLNTPVFARSKRGYVGTGRGAPIYLCMAQAKICKTIGRHAPDAQIGRAIRRRSPRPFRAVRESKGEGSYGCAGGPADGGVAAELALAVGDRAPWAPALDGRMLLLATHDVADAQALDISDITTL